MRTALLFLAMTVASVPALPAQADVVLPAVKTVYLYGAADLALLRAANPDHYARAQRIFALANRFCRPGPAQLQPVLARVKDVNCAGNILRTSNPPKWQLSFTLDDTRYIALVTVTDDPPRLIHAQ
jgi:hypothetical protein